MKRKLYTLLMMMLVGASCLWAQGISVTTFKPLQNDITANLAGTQVKDQNGEVAALIKVVTTQTGFSFEGGAAGIVKVKQEVGEIWVYVPHGIKKITLKHPQLGILRDYYFPCPIEAACTYEMTLASGEVRTVVTQDAGGSFLAMTVDPKNASVYIDGELQPVDGNGELMTMLPYGDHQYRIEANGYMNEAGVINIGKETVTKVVRLKSALATLTINSATPGADIIINNQKRGTGDWSGRLTAGMYLIEVQKPGYQSYQTSIQLAKQEEKSLTIPALAAKYATMVVSVKPIGAEVWMDGEKLGASPSIFNKVLAMKHSVVIKKDGYKSLEKTIELAEGEKQTIDGTLEKVQSAAASSPAGGSQGANTYVGSTTNSAGIDMVYVQGGSFIMGKDAASEDEKPEHNVTLSNYYISKTEITQGQWKAVMGYTKNSRLSDNQPVCATFSEAQQFVRALNQKTGKSYRLPTEAEWEFAARGGNNSRGYKYSGSNNADEVAWYGSLSECKPVATKKPNELGIYDMSGNLEEWTADYYDSYSSQSQVNPTGPSRGSKRVVRGGGYWHSMDWAVRIANRDDQEENSSIFGFRVVMSASGSGASMTQNLPSSGNYSPRANGTLKLFPVWGVDLGVSTKNDLKNQGYKVENRSDGDKYASIRGIQCWDFTHDGKFETMYFTHYDKIPTEWESQGFVKTLSYNGYIKFFTQNGYSYKVTKSPSVKEWSGRNTLSAELEFTSGDGRYQVRISFDYGNDNGEGFTVDSPNSAYSFNIKAL